MVADRVVGEAAALVELARACADRGPCARRAARCRRSSAGARRRPGTACATAPCDRRPSCVAAEVTEVEHVIEGDMALVRPRSSRSTVPSRGDEVRQTPSQRSGGRVASARSRPSRAGGPCSGAGRGCGCPRTRSRRGGRRRGPASTRACRQWPSASMPRGWRPSSCAWPITSASASVTSCSSRVRIWRKRWSPSSVARSTTRRTWRCWSQKSRNSSTSATAVS